MRETRQTNRPMIGLGKEKITKNKVIVVKLSGRGKRTCMGRVGV